MSPLWKAPSTEVCCMTGCAKSVRMPHACPEPGKVFVTLWCFVHEVYIICYLLYKQDIHGLRIMGKPGKSLKFVYGLQSPWIFAYMHGKPAIRSGKLKIIYYLLIRSGSCLYSQCINACCSIGPFILQYSALKLERWTLFNKLCLWLAKKREGWWYRVLTAL